MFPTSKTPPENSEEVMTELPLLGFHCHGQVTQDEVGEVRSILEECYIRLSRWLQEQVEVHLMDTPTRLAMFLQSEKAELGIETSGDEAFICSHDAWRGFPRLLICMERLSALSLVARLGVLRHEAAHTVLHGGLAYYVFRIPRDCLKMARDKGVGTAVLQQVLYYCATAVKDFEATELLLRQGYEECQVAFAQTQFLPSEEDKLAWLLAKSHPQARLLFLTSQLKTFLMAWPLKLVGLIDLERSIDSMLNYIEPGERERLLSLATNIAEELSQDTHTNVSRALGQVLQALL